MEENNNKKEISYLDLIIEVILNNARLNYEKNDLMINDEKPLLEIIKVIAADKYIEAYEFLKSNTKENGSVI